MVYLRVGAGARSAIQCFVQYTHWGRNWRRRRKTPWLICYFLKAVKYAADHMEARRKYWSERAVERPYQCRKSLLIEPALPHPPGRKTLRGVCDDHHGSPWKFCKETLELCCVLRLIFTFKDKFRTTQPQEKYPERGEAEAAAMHLVKTCCAHITVDVCTKAHQPLNG